MPSFRPALLLLAATLAAQTDWPKSGGDLANRNYSPLTQINRGNVADLKGVWRVHLNSGNQDKFSGEAQPVVQNGVIYIVTGADDVFAIGVKSGQILWKYQPNIQDEITVLCCGWINRGVALGDGKVFVGQLDGRLVALDQNTGRPVWSIQAERWQDGFSITSAPLYFDGMVITGFAGAEFATRGRVKAFDAKDGHFIWTFYTIPGPGEPGHETWPASNDAWQHGGATVWQTPALDPALGLLYFTTANPGPSFDGHFRPGDNLYSASMVAIDAKTGKYRWHFQQVHHDLWDYDAPNPVILFDVKINGVLRKAAAEASKTGWVYILDRITGKPLLGIDEKPVPQDPRQHTAATQPYPRGDAFIRHQVEIAPEDAVLVNQGRIFTPFWSDVPTLITPSALGGANWPPSSYDPASNYFYVCANDGPQFFKSGGADAKMVPAGQSYSGSTFGEFPLGITGIFAALDMKTNKLVWRQVWHEPCYSGSVTTAGGLVFAGRTDGRLLAMNSATSKHLWDFQTGAGQNSPTAVFEQEGEEYVVAYSGGSALMGGNHGDTVWLFSLKGTLSPPAPESESKSDAPATATADLDHGRELYATTCSACHGANGEGSHAPPLTNAHDLDKIAQMIKQGGAQMPAFAAKLTDKDIQDISAYVHEKLAR